MLITFFLDLLTLVVFFIVAKLKSLLKNFTIILSTKESSYYILKMINIVEYFKKSMISEIK